MENTKWELYLVLSVVLLMGSGIILFLENETNKVTRTSNIILPAIAGQSFYIGCIAGDMPSEKCMELMEKYKADTAEINRIED